MSELWVVNLGTVAYEEALKLQRPIDGLKIVARGVKEDKV